MNEKLDWIEKRADENLKFRIKTGETLAYETNKLLTMLLAATGALVAFIVNSYSKTETDAVFSGVVGLTIWLMVITVIVITKCSMSKDVIPIGNEPKNLNLKNYSLEEIKEFELENVQKSITHTTSQNLNKAYWLDNAKLATAISPLIFIFSSLLHCL